MLTQTDDWRKPSQEAKEAMEIFIAKLEKNAWWGEDAFDEGDMDMAELRTELLRIITARQQEYRDAYRGHLLELSQILKDEQHTSLPTRYELRLLLTKAHCWGNPSEEAEKAMKLFIEGITCPDGEAATALRAKDATAAIEKAKKAGLKVAKEAVKKAKAREAVKKAAELDQFSRHRRELMDIVSQREDYVSGGLLADLHSSLKKTPTALPTSDCLQNLLYDTDDWRSPSPNAELAMGQFIAKLGQKASWWGDEDNFTTEYMNEDELRTDLLRTIRSRKEVRRNDTSPPLMDLYQALQQAPKLPTSYDLRFLLAQARSWENPSKKAKKDMEEYLKDIKSDIQQAAEEATAASKTVGEETPQEPPTKRQKKSAPKAAEEVKRQLEEAQRKLQQEEEAQRKQAEDEEQRQREEAEVQRKQEEAEEQRKRQQEEQAKAAEAAEDAEQAKRQQEEEAKRKEQEEATRKQQEEAKKTREADAPADEPAPKRQKIASEGRGKGGTALPLDVTIAQLFPKLVCRTQQTESPVAFEARTVTLSPSASTPFVRTPGPLPSTYWADQDNCGYAALVWLLGADRRAPLFKQLCNSGASCRDELQAELAPFQLGLVPQQLSSADIIMGILNSPHCWLLQIKFPNGTRHWIPMDGSRRELYLGVNRTQPGAPLEHWHTTVPVYCNASEAKLFFSNLLGCQLCNAQVLVEFEY